MNKYQITDEQREKLAKVAQDLMEIWEERPFDEECEQGWDYGYRGGLVKLTVKGGYLSGCADFSWNDVITDIFANEKLACITKVKYEDIIKNSQEVANERDRLITANVKQLNASAKRIQDVEEL